MAIKPITYQGQFNFGACEYAHEIKARFVDTDKANGFYKGYGAELAATIIGQQIQIGTGLFLVQARMAAITSAETVTPTIVNGHKGYVCIRIETFHPQDDDNCSIIVKTAPTFEGIQLIQEDCFATDADTVNKTYELPIYSFEISGSSIINLTKLITSVEKQIIEKLGTIITIDGEELRIFDASDLAYVIRKTSAEWAAYTSILASNQFGYDTTTKTLKLGDGITAWADLPPFYNLKEQILGLMHPYDSFVEGDRFKTLEDVQYYCGAGTWIRLPEGTVTISSGANYPTGSTGGEAEHTLTVDELPSHNHELHSTANDNIYTGDKNSGHTAWASNQYAICGDGSYQYNNDNQKLIITNTGNNKSINNMPPYYATNKWQKKQSGFYKTDGTIIDWAVLLSNNYFTLNSSGALSVGSNISAFKNLNGYLILDVAVKTISANCFENCTLLTKIIIPESVTAIPNYMCRNCNVLGKVDIPLTVTSIGTYAFYGCANLTDIIIPNGVTSIGASAFENCNALTKIIIPDSVLTIGSDAFENCENLKTITLGKNITNIGNNTFQECYKVETINYNITTMGDLGTSNWVFRQVGTAGNGITLNIGDNVKRIPAYIFSPSTTQSYIPKITNVVWGQNSQCTEIAKYAFRQAITITSITIPASITTIGSNCFVGCTNLTTATFNDTNGWKAGSTTISSMDLANTSTAATYLKTTYVSQTWTKS